MKKKKLGFIIPLLILIVVIGIYYYTHENTKNKKPDVKNDIPIVKNISTASSSVVENNEISKKMIAAEKKLCVNGIEPLGIHVGSVIDTLTVTSIEPHHDDKCLSVDNYRIKFKGEIELVGTIGSTELYGYIFSTYDNSGKPYNQNNIQKLISSSVGLFGDDDIINNLKENDKIIRIKIDNLTLNGYPSDVINSARLIKIISK